jgi:integrase
VAPRPNPFAPCDFGALLVAARDFTSANRWAPGTVTSYERYWGDFTVWCRGRDDRPLPARTDTVLAWVVERAAPVLDGGVLSLAGVRAGTADTMLSALGAAHGLAGYPSPTAHPAVAGLRAAIRAVEARPVRRARPLTVDLLVRLDDAPASLRRRSWQRDRDLVVVGTCAGMRADDLTRLRTDDLELRPERLRLRVPCSKTDQVGRGELVVVTAHPGHPYCPVAAARRLVDAAGPGAPLLPSARLSGRSIGARAVSDAVKAVTAHLPPDPHGLVFTGHSMRRGFCTSARAQGAPITAIARAARMATWANVLRYVDRPGGDGVAAVLEFVELMDEADRDG